MSSSLIPGYTQVKSFNPDDYEIEEEIEYVTLDLGATEPTLVPSSSTYRLIGLDTPTPFLQLSGTIFKGAHDSLLGTELLFTDEKDPLDWSKRSIDHLSNTSQRIKFHEVTLAPFTPSATVTSAEKEKEKKSAQTVDRLTGKEPPPKRRGGRKRKDPDAAKSNAKEEAEAVESDIQQAEASEMPARREFKPRKAKADEKGKGKVKAVEEDEDMRAAMEEFLDVGSSPQQDIKGGVAGGSGTNEGTAPLPSPMFDMEGLHSMDPEDGDGEYNPMEED